ncbi:gliding motility-associated C-terminal domain-containing protein [uncultured Draconibacterium sp.]|uniref:T9SS type B sorting domain-containing protein n=1 Tax=uncultured Draconibacterium sp. TaxID=1573823 RepID=UPI0032165217
MKNFTKIFRVSLIQSLVFFVFFNNSYAEGTKQLEPSYNSTSNGKVYLCTNNGSYNDFANYGSTDTKRLYIRIKNTNERIYFGFTEGQSSPDGSYVDSKIRIVGPNGTVAAEWNDYTNFITGSNDQTRYNKTVAGPTQLGNTNGYNATVCIPNQGVGDYYIEFDRESGWGSEVYYKYWDITVADGAGGNAIPGRIWSKAWAFAMPSVNNPFNGAFYVYAPEPGYTPDDATQKGFVTKIDFDGAGFQPWYFNVAFNSTGTANTGNAIEDRKSKYDQFALSPEYGVFLTDPDHSIWQDGAYDGNISIGGISRCGETESNISITVNTTGNVDILLDFHGSDEVFTAGTADRIISANVSPAPGAQPPYTVSVPWDGKDGLGNSINVGTTIHAVVNFGQSAFHFPVYDVEYNTNGFSASSIRPTAPSGFELKFYWDDSNFGSGTTETNGCNPISSDCHTWTFNGNNNSPQIGNLSTMNTWWYANINFDAKDLTMPTYIQASVTGTTDANCYGANDGTIEVSISDGATPYSFKVDGNPHSANINSNPYTLTNIPEGTHSVTIIDGNGCVIELTGIVINEPTQIVASGVGSQLNCFGDTDGTITMTVSGGTTPYSYSLDGGTTPHDLTGLTAGTYIVTVTDANGCSDTESVTITQPDSEVAASVDSKTDVLCFDEATGSATASGSGGVGPYTYSWNTSPVQTAATATGLAAGKYIVTVTDANGCSDTASVTITQPDSEVSASVDSNTDVLCYGEATGSAAASGSGGVGPYTYSWNISPVQTAATATGLAAGKYIVTVTDANGCSDTASVTITQPDSEVAASVDSKTDVLCFDEATGSATASGSGGVGPYTYSWNTSPVQTAATATGLAAGKYIVTVTDANGCSDTASVTITQPDSEVAASVDSKTDVLCFDEATGSATASGSGGVGPYTYSWNTSPVQTAATATGLAAGKYIVTVTDANGCSDTASVTITQPDSEVAASVDSKTDVLCFDEATGSATASGSGGVGPYTYSWNTSPVQTAATATGLAAGKYIVTVTDANGCSDTASVTITQPDSEVAASVDSKTDVLCFDEATGSATASGSGGVGSFTYSWNTSPVQTAATATGLAAGKYIVTVTDANGCSDTASVTITQPDSEVSASVDSNTDVLCYGEATGSATASGSGGVGPYTYSWNTSPVQTAATATGLAAGKYIVTVTDANGCSDTASVTITQPDSEVSASVDSKTDVLCFGEVTGSATASGSGGVGSFTYSWNTSPVQTAATATGLAAGKYIVTVTDANGCSDTASVTITQPDSEVAASVDSKTDVLCFDEATGSATASGSGGVGPYTYSWNTSPVQTAATATGLAAGKYIVTVTDANGCSDTASVTITQPDSEVAASVDSKTDVLCFDEATGSATASGSGGVGPYTYSWNTSPVQTAATATGLAAGKYIVTVTDANGCSDTASVTITQPDSEVAASVDSKTDVLCFDEATGSATASGSGGVGSFTYSWNTSPVQTAATATGLAAGKYIVTVTDANGCSDTASVTITQPDSEVSASVDSNTDVLCYGEATGSATASGSGGVGPYTYSWNTSPVQTAATATGLAAGKYIVTVTDANGCSDTASVTITQPDSEVSASVDSKTDVLCFGEVTGSATASGSGGVGSFTYSWNTSPVQTAATATGLAAGKYIVTVTDANGCSDTASVTITQPASALTCDADQDSPVTIYGHKDGVATVTPSGGTAPYTYLWDNGDERATADTLEAGYHEVTVTDANGCETTCNVTIGEPNQLTCDIDLVFDVDCYGGSNGSAKVTATGGVLPYTYLWDNNETTQTASQLNAGKHTVTVTDKNGAKTTCDIQIDQPDSIIITAPKDTLVSTCLTQQEVNTEFTEWLARVKVIGGKDVQISYDTLNIKAPNACGGYIDVIWTVTSACPEDVKDTATFTVPDAIQLDVSGPKDFTASSCDFDNQAALDAAFQTWVDSFNVVTNACGATASDISNLTAPDLCEGGTVNVTFGIGNNCTNDTVRAAFTINAADPLDVEGPQDFSASSCDFDNQAALDAAFQTWADSFNVVTNACGATASNISNLTAPDLCEGGTVNVTFGIGNNCTNDTVRAAFTINAADPLDVEGPQDFSASSCDFDNQAALDAAFQTWVDSFNVVTNACGATASDISNLTAPDLCEGGTVNVTFGIGNNCTNDTVRAAFTINAADPLDVEGPQDFSASSCDFDNQAALDAAFQTWVDSFNVVTNACGATASDISNLTAPDLCEGGTVNVTFGIGNNCTNDTVRAAFTINAADPLDVEGPQDFSASSCDFDNQAALDAAFQTWADSFNVVTNACGATASNISNLTAPDLCEGGTVNVTFGIGNNCTNDTVRAAFTINAADPLDVEGPQDFSASSCDFDNQAALDAAFQTWVDSFNVVTNACGATASDISNLTAPDLCEGGTVNVTFGIGNNCTNDTVRAAFTINAADPLDVEGPQDFSASSCDFDNQAALDAAFQTWVDSFNVVTNACGATASDISNLTAPDLCEGGTVNVTFGIGNNCTNDTVRAAFTINAADPLDVEGPQDFSASSCDFDNQAALDAAFQTWADSFNVVTNACGATASNISNLTAPDLCEGGTVNVTFGIGNNCTNDTVRAAFTINAADPLDVEGPQDFSASSCDFDNQAALDAAFQTWVDSFNVVTNACGATASDISNLTAPDLCEGGTVNVTFGIGNNCTNDTVRAAFTINAADPLDVEGPQDFSASSCDFDNQAALDAAFQTWVDSFNVVTNACGATASDISNLTAPDLCEGGTVNVTFGIGNNCTNDTVRAAFTINAADPLDVEGPQDFSASSCDFDNQAALDAAFQTWVDSFNVVTNACGATASDISNLTAPDLCEGGTVNVTFGIGNNCTNDTVRAAFTINAADTVDVKGPEDYTAESCKFISQAEVDKAFEIWLNEFQVLSNECDAEPSSLDYKTPTWCEGGSVTVVFGLGNNCTSDTVSATFTINPAPAVVLNAPQDTIVDACLGEEVYTLYDDWLARATYSGGCGLEADHNGDDMKIKTCGDTIQVIWTAISNCQESINDTAYFVVEESPELVLTCPADTTEIACQDETAINASFDNWIAAFGLQGGCNADVTYMINQIEVSLDTIVAPDVCGGSITLYAMASGDCDQSDNCSSTFTIMPASEIEVQGPDDFRAISCDYPDQDSLDRAFTEWIEMFSVVDSGCGVTESDLTQYSAPTLCTGGTTTVKFGAADHCSNDSVTAIFTIIPADTIEVKGPGNMTVNSCDYTDQTTLDAAFNTWLDSFNVISNECKAVPSTLDYNAPTLCDGGKVTVVFGLGNNCTSDTVSAIFTLNAPAPVALEAPADTMIEACAGEEVYSMYYNWVNNYTVSGGCDPQVNNTAGEPQFNMCGDSIQVIWTATDLCEEGVNDTAYFIIKDALPIVLNAPNDTTISACTSTNEIDSMFGEWLNKVSYDDVCNIEVWNNSEEVEVINSCGDSVMVIWTATNYCQNDVHDTAYFVVEEQDAPTIKVMAMDTTIDCTGENHIIIGDNQEKSASIVADPFTLWLENHGYANAVDACGNTIPNKNWTNNFSGYTYSEECPVIKYAEVVFTATDECGKSVSDTAVFTVQDTTPPELEAAPADTTVDCDDVPEMATLTAEDNCGTALVTPSADTTFSELCASSYMITRTWVAEDECGNTTEHTQLVTVQDTIAPKWDTQDGALDVELYCSDTTGLRTALALAPIASDNCTSEVNYEMISNDTLQGECNGYFTITRTWVATDECGNTSENFVQIINYANKVILEANATNVNCYDANDGTITAYANCGASITVNGGEYVQDSLYAPGQYIVVASATDSNGEIVCIDSDTLTIIQPDAITATIDTIVCDSLVLNNETFTASDTYTQVLTASNGCDSTLTINLIVLNSPDETITITECDQYQLNGVVYTSSGTYSQVIESEDGCTGTLTLVLTINRSTQETIYRTACDTVFLNGKTYTESGRYIQRLTNAAGCDSSLYVVVTILNEDPIELISEASDLTVECDGSGNTEALENWLATHGTTGLAEAGFGTITWSNDFEALTPGCCNTGYTTVTFTATDDCGNSVSTTATFTTIDTVAPTFTAPADITIYSGDDCQYDASIEVTGDVTDESDICCTDLNAEYTDVVEQGACVGEWIITRTWTLVDGCENEADPQIQVITVMDNTAPTAVCNDLTVQLDANGTATITVADIDGGSSDNCGIDTMFIDTETFYCGNLGENEVTLTIVDQCGNTSTCTATVTVEEGDANCNNVRVLAAPDVLTLIYCPGGYVSGDIDLFANDEGFTQSTVNFNLLTDLPEGVSITDGALNYVNEEANEAVITLTYSVCHNVYTAECDTADVTIHVLLDSDCDGVPDRDDIDDDDDGILDIFEQENPYTNTDPADGDIDTDNDGIVDRLDIDSDNDGIVDNIEWQQNIPEGQYHESEFGGVDLGFDYYPPLGVDSDGDGWDDRYDDNENGGQNIFYLPFDMDLDGTPDFQDTDSDGDDIPDYIEGWDANVHDTIADTDFSGTDSDGDGLDDAYDTYDTSEEWLHGKNAIGSDAPLQDMAGDTINNIRDWRDIYVPPIEGDDFQTEGCELNIPDGFSPNDDNYNDYFEIEFVCAEGDQIFEEVYSNAKIEIFNRWGNLVFEKERYGNTQSWGNYEAWWDGRSTNDLQVGNDKLPAGTYFYILYLGDGEVTTGSIFLNN